MKKYLLGMLLLMLVIAPVSVKAQSLSELQTVVNQLTKLVYSLIQTRQGMVLGTSTAPTITVTNPAVILTGTTLPITWTSSGVQYVAITWNKLLSTGAVETWGWITHVAPNTGSFSWPVPTSLVPGTYLVQVWNVDSSGGNANTPANSGTFQIAPPTPTPAPTVGAEITLTGTPTISAVTTTNSNTQTGSNSTTTLTATFNLRIRAMGADLLLGTNASPNPMFASSTRYFRVYKDGIATDYRAASSTSASINTSQVTMSGNTATLSQGNTADVNVTFIFVGRTLAGAPLGLGVYAIGMEGATWMPKNSTGAITSTFMSGQTAWRTPGVALAQN